MRILCTVPPIPTCSDEARKNPRAIVGRPASVLRSQVSCASIHLSRNTGHLSCSAFRLSCLFASILFPFNPSFSPFAVNRLPRHPAPCYHWPMSARTSNPPPPVPLNRPPLAHRKNAAPTTPAFVRARLQPCRSDGHATTSYRAAFLRECSPSHGSRDTDHVARPLPLRLASPAIQPPFFPVRCKPLASPLAPVLPLADVRTHIQFGPAPAVELIVGLS